MGEGHRRVSSEPRNTSDGITPSGWLDSKVQAEHVVDGDRFEAENTETCPRR
jgi:hypothetical protein